MPCSTEMNLLWQRIVLSSTESRAALPTNCGSQLAEGCPAWQLKDVQRIREAVALLSPPDVQALQDVQFLPSHSVVQALQTKWKVDLAALVLVSQATLLPIYGVSLVQYTCIVDSQLEEERRKRRKELTARGD